MTTVSLLVIHSLLLMPSLVMPIQHIWKDTQKGAIKTYVTDYLRKTRFVSVFVHNSGYTVKSRLSENRVQKWVDVEYFSFKKQGSVFTFISTKSALHCIL